MKCELSSYFLSFVRIHLIFQAFLRLGLFLWILFQKKTMHLDDYFRSPSLGRLVLCWFYHQNRCKSRGHFAIQPQPDQKWTRPESAQSSNQQSGGELNDTLSTHIIHQLVPPSTWEVLQMTGLRWSTQNHYTEGEYTYMSKNCLILDNTKKCAC